VTPAFCTPCFTAKSHGRAVASETRLFLEGFALEQVIGRTGKPRPVLLGYPSAALNLISWHGSKANGTVLSSNMPMHPAPPASMHIAVRDLSLEHLWIIYPGHQEYSLDDKISVFLSTPFRALPPL